MVGSEDQSQNQDQYQERDQDQNQDQDLANMPMGVEKLYKAIQTVNDNVKELSDMVNKHSKAITYLNEKMESIDGGPPQGNGQTPPNNGDEFTMKDVTDFGKMLLQRNQPNPMADVFNNWLNGIIQGQQKLSESSANMNNAIADMITGSIQKKVANDVGTKVSRNIMEE